MKANYWIILIAFLVGCKLVSQETASKKYNAGYTTLTLIDSSRTYKPNTPANDPLHFRPLELDIWYPTEERTSLPMTFKDLWIKYEERATRYQDEDYNGVSEELALYLMAGLGIDVKDGSRLLALQTHSNEAATIAQGTFPVVVYLAGFNSMGAENYTLLENLAQKGFIVISIWSMGRYPGQMTNELMDTMEQVNDADFALKTLKQTNELPIDFENIGVLGYSWGGMSSAILLDLYPKIKAFVSLDGTETYYFGENEIDDAYLDTIYQANVLFPEKNQAAYFALESGNKLDEFRPTHEYHYFKKTNAPKYYLRHSQSAHEDFSSFPSVLLISEERTNIYSEISKSTVLFFEKYLTDKKGFQQYYEQLISKDRISDTPYVFSTEPLQKLVLSGTIKDAQDNTPLPYVNIGILNKEMGTVSNRNGVFELALNETHANDTLRISMIGYEAKTIPVQELANKKGAIQIALKEKISELNEVVVTAKKWKYKTLGNKTKSKFMGHLFYYDQLGKEMGIRINTGKRPAFVDTFNFHVSYNRFSAKTFFRLNIYDASKGQQSNNLLKENIVIAVEPEQTGMISTNLKPYDIVLTDDVIVTLEWIDNEGDVLPTEALVISVGLFTGGSYERNSKQGKLKKKLKGLGLGFTLEVRS